MFGTGTKKIHRNKYHGISILRDFARFADFNQNILNRLLDSDKIRSLQTFKFRWILFVNKLSCPLMQYCKNRWQIFRPKDVRGIKMHFWNAVIKLAQQEILEAQLVLLYFCQLDSSSLHHSCFARMLVLVWYHQWCWYKTDIDLW